MNSEDIENEKEVAKISKGRRKYKTASVSRLGYMGRKLQGVERKMDSYFTACEKCSPNEWKKIVKERKKKCMQAIFPSYKAL